MVTSEIEQRKRDALFLVLTGPVLAVVSRFLGIAAGSISSPTQLIYSVLVPVLPFWVLAVAECARRRDGAWRYSRLAIRTLGSGIAASILAPYIWWFVEYGGDRIGPGVNYTLGCLFVLLPVLMPFVLVLGLGLAAESLSDESDKARP
jgi:hypothetical protein